MAHKRNKLSVRIPWLLEAVAEGPWAIAALLILAAAVIGTKSLGWW